MTVLTFGPPRGVRNTTEPYDDSEVGDYSQLAVNGYFRDPSLLSGFQARPGFTLTTPGTGTNAGQGAHSHTAPDGTVYNFIVSAGKLRRLSSNFATGTDVTPGGAIAISTTARVFFVSVGTSMIVTDGVNTPWVATNLGATPVTGTVIDIDGAGGPWTASRPTVYQDSVVFPTLTTPGGSAVIAHIGFVWSEPNQPTVGYTQSGYANFFNPIEQGTDPIFGLWGTNIGLFYWRETSIGLLAGPLYSFSTTATRDARSSEVGSITPATIAQFGNNIFFSDAFGRAWMMPLTGAPQPIWKQMAAAAISQVPFTLASLQESSTAAIVPELNLYAIASWGLSSTTRPSFAHMFDGESGNYAGEWIIRYSASPGSDLGICVLGQLKDASNLPVFCAMGGTDITVGDNLHVLTHLTDSVWMDVANTAVPLITCYTNKMGYGASTVYNADLATLITMSAAPVIVNVSWANGVSSVTTSGSNASSDGTYRTVIGLDVLVARSLTFAITPTTATTQWGFQRVEVPVVLVKAGPEDR